MELLKIGKRTKADSWETSTETWDIKVCCKQSFRSDYYGSRRFLKIKLYGFIRLLDKTRKRQAKEFVIETFSSFSI